MGSTTNHYDLIVLGADVSGLVAAALVARRGKRVLVIPHGSPEGAYRLGGRLLSLEAEPVVHLSTPPIKRALTELGLWQQIRREHLPLPGLLHMVTRDHRLDLQPAQANWGEETEREWPSDPLGEAVALQRRWAEATDEVFEQLLSSDNALVAEGFWSRRFLTRVASQLPGRDLDDLEPLRADHPWRRAASAILPWLQHLSPAQLGKAASLRLAGLWAKGPLDVPAAGRRIRQVLLQRIHLHSGEVKPDLRVAEVLVRRGKVVGVSLLGKRDRYGCDHMIVATDPRRLLDGTFVPEQLPRPLTGLLAAVDEVAQRFVLHLEVADGGLSPALAGTVVCVNEDDADGHGVGTHYVRFWSPESDPPHHLTVTRVAGTDEPVDRMRERILDDLDERGVLPFVRSHLTLVHSPHDGRGATDGSGNPLGGPDPGVVTPMSPIYGVDGEPSLGVGVLPYGSGIKNLYFASRLTLPGLGLEGEFVAGTMTAGLVASPARSPFSRSRIISRA